LFASAYVAPTVCDFLARYPDVQVSLTTSDLAIDMYDGRFDLAVRVRELPDSGLKVRRVGELRVVTFGAPSHFAKRDRPKHPQDLGQHECIVRGAVRIRKNGGLELEANASPYTCADGFERTIRLRFTRPSWQGSELA
jgi:DNA-binding transcriptional LysR family regulator